MTLLGSIPKHKLAELIADSDPEQSREMYRIFKKIIDFRHLGLLELAPTPDEIRTIEDWALGAKPFPPSAPPTIDPPSPPKKSVDEDSKAPLAKNVSQKPIRTQEPRPIPPGPEVGEIYLMWNRMPWEYDDEEWDQYKRESANAGTPLPYYADYMRAKRLRHYRSPFIAKSFERVLRGESLENTTNGATYREEHRHYGKD